MLFGTQILGPHRRPIRLVALVLAAALVAVGCGQKGPLYMPAPADQPSSKTPTPR
jgi:predicted small lipoprotein YifL